MRARLRKKRQKQQRLKQARVGQLGRALGPIFAREILLEMKRPSWLTGTAEEWLAWDNQCHPHWTRTSWGSRPPRQGILCPRETDR